MQYQRILCKKKVRESIFNVTSADKHRGKQILWNLPYHDTKPLFVLVFVLFHDWICGPAKLLLCEVLAASWEFHF